MWDGLEAGEVTVLEGEDDLLVGDGFAVFAEKFEHALAVEGAEVAVAGGFGFVDAVERPGVAGVEIALFAAVAEHFDFAAERHGECGEAFRHAERVGEHAAGAELEVFDFAGRRNAVVRGAGDGQLGLGEQFRREVGLAEHQGGAHGQRGLAAGEELLALDVELSIESVFFGVVIAICFLASAIAFVVPKCN